MLYARRQTGVFVPHLLVTAALLCSACGSDSSPWSVVVEGLDEALLSVSGTSERDVWAVGADAGRGPLVLRFDGERWARVETGSSGHLWWVHVVRPDLAFLGGERAAVLRWDGERFERMRTPGVAAQTVFGVWAGGPDDVWAVGGHAGRTGFVWHFDGEAWHDLPLPPGLPSVTEFDDPPSMFKVWGDGAGTVWIAGGQGTILRARNGALEQVETGTEATLFTLHGHGEDVVAVGGDGQAMLVERRGEAFVPGPPQLTETLQGVFVPRPGEGVATGVRGAVFERGPSGWEQVDTGLRFRGESLHAVWVDPAGGVWTVGGNVLSSSLDAGVLWHRGAAVPTYEAPAVETPVDDVECPAGDRDRAPDASIARRWNEQILGAIRRDVPNPGKHARNLFHLSVAMWDAYALYDSEERGYLVTEKATAADVEAARREAISYAAFRVLSHRYEASVGRPVTFACLRGFMERLGYDPDDTTESGAGPRAHGNRIGRTVIETFLHDGANETGGYADTTGYQSPNDPLYVDRPGAWCAEPSQWQKLNLSVAETQNGILLDTGLQPYIGSNWGLVRPFALEREASLPYFDVGTIPALDLEAMKGWASEVVRRTAHLDHEDGELMDISPGAFGNNPLGSNAGTGHPLNPVTGQPYAANLVPRGDFGRVLAEYWADGPDSETPPGHWNTIANAVSSHPLLERRWLGEGAPLDPLGWDVRLYLVLNGAVHDAAVAAWEQKRLHTTSRPITLIRYMGGLGQSSDPELPSYHPLGLPLEPGIIELVTAESAAGGERHAHLARYVGQVAVRSWRGEPGDRHHEVGGVAWIRAVDWIPYQRRTFVSPAFPGYVSGHSTFSRAAAEVLAAVTGSPYFPGGLGEFVARRNAYLEFEQGPNVEVRLQWGTYFDAADQAGQSRIWGGIHIAADDFDGRTIGREVGLRAVARGLEYIAPRP